MNMNVSFLSRRLVRIRAKDLYPLCFVPEPRSPSYFLIVAVPKLQNFFYARLTLSPYKALGGHIQNYTAWLGILSLICNATQNFDGVFPENGRQHVMCVVSCVRVCGALSWPAWEGR